MDNPELLKLAQFIFSLVVLFFLYMAFTRLHRHIRRANGFLGAPLLTKSSIIGTYVKFKGNFAGQELRTPVSNRPCSYWNLIIRAEFETKMKKPGSGMQTHRPVLHRDSSEGFPLLLSDGKETVQMILENNLSVMGNPNFTERVTRSIPLRELDKLSKDKYQKYVSEEYFCPFNSEVTAWGCILEKNKNSVLLSYGKNIEMPPLMVLGDESVLKDSFSSANMYCIALIAYSNLFMIGLWTVMSEIPEIISLTIVCGALSVGAYMLLRGTKLDIKPERSQIEKSFL